MNILKLLLITFILSSCLVKKPAEEEVDLSGKISIVSRGLFTVDSTLYFSNGVEFYCAFDSWKKAEYFSDKMKDQPMIVLDELPDSMKFIPVCQIEHLIEKENSLKLRN